jgi:hypothetical protein
MQAGSTPQEFVTEWCSSDESRTSICLTAKAVAEARIGAGPSMCMPSGGEEEVEDETPWWRRPPRTWPPRVDDTRLILGDVLAVYGAAFVALSALATPDDRASASVMMAWPSEGGAMATAWIVGAVRALLAHTPLKAPLAMPLCLSAVAYSYERAQSSPSARSRAAAAISRV